MKQTLPQRARRAPHSGTVVSFRKGDRTVYAARVLLKDGTRKQKRLPIGWTREKAEARAADLQALEDATGTLYRAKLRKAGVPLDGETADNWHERFLESREGTVGGTRDARWIWGKWVSPTIGPLPMVAVTRDHIETIRDLLDAAMAAGTIRARTARNTWSVLVTAFKAAVGSKQRDLRVRTENPCVGVLAPEGGESRRKVWLYPSELSKLLACDSVPLEWRELYCVAAYIFARPAELAELRWRDCDLATGHVHISRAIDWQSEEAKEPKTRNGVRTVPIPATLLPLLERMRVGASDDALVVPAMLKAGKRDAASILRKHLALAGVNHPRLFRDDETFMPVGFRSFRDSGITWLAIEGVALAKMQRRAGHDHISTTLGYVKAAEDFSAEGIGVPFGPLPSAMLGSVTASVTKATPAGNKGWVDRDLKPDSEGSPRVVPDGSVSGAPSSDHFPPDHDAGNVEVTSAITLTTEAALALAIERASAAGQWSVVAMLAKELEARRFAGSNVVPLGKSGRGRT